MKIVYVALVIAFFGLGSRAQVSGIGSGEQERMFFPSDALWGYAQFDLAPPHNEIDPNICAADAGKFGGVSAVFAQVAPVAPALRTRSPAAATLTR